jgi:ABC-type multidrug transport system fused ATPase/permease subunit
MSIITKLRHIFTRKVKIQLIFLTAGIIIGAQIETLTLSLIQPFIMILTDPDVIYSNRILYFVYSLFGFGSFTPFLAFLAAVIAAVYVIRGFYVYFFAKIQNRFLAKNSAILSNLLLIHTLKKPYLFHANNNPSKLQGLVVRTSERLYGVVNNSLLLLIDGFMTLFILVFLLISSFYMTMVVLFFAFICIVVYFKILKGKIKSSGDEEERGMVQINKSVLQALNGVKEIKISRREKYFTDKFKAIRLETVKFRERMQTMRQLPRLFMESLCFSGAFLVVAGIIFAGVDVQVLLPQLGVFMIAAFKMFPAISRMLANITQIMRHSRAIHRVYEVLYEKDDKFEQSRPEPEASITSRDIIISKLTFRYPKSKKAVLKKISFVIPHNKSVAFIGPSGAGKSTLADIILGILSPQYGSVTFNGKSIHHNFKSWAQNVGYVPQVIYLMDETLIANVAFGIDKDKIDEAKVWRALEQAQLKEFVESLPNGLQTEVGDRGVRLSGGQRQRVGIARALYDNPNILVLDEATSSLDNETEEAVMSAIRGLKGRKTMIIVAHRLSTIEHCDIVYEIKNGTVLKKE